MKNISWEGTTALDTKLMICGYCGSNIASNSGYKTSSKEKIYICHHCYKPNYFDESGNQTPGCRYGYEVQKINDDLVNKMYQEARSCYSVSAYTAAVLCCRKLLMHIAVTKGAEENKSFVYYVNYLGDKHYVPPDASSWVDHIREKGNEANHEIVMINKEEAEQLINFVGILLKVIFEFPSLVNPGD